MWRQFFFLRFSFLSRILETKFNKTSFDSAKLFVLLSTKKSAFTGFGGYIKWVTRKNYLSHSLLFSNRTKLVVLFTGAADHKSKRGKLFRQPYFCKQPDKW
jgi:hypothetical protein